MDLHLAGKTAVGTAASGGIGGAVVRTLVAEGVRVLGTDRTVSDQSSRAAPAPWRPTCSSSTAGC
ncbi:hypothetical protein ACFHW2_18245 [Actinomadura sp. LOL_016]|uniref:hypothetical protein n=1 Tax=unclassified Actinomadura TaxID=2626254 RepID=UPI003A80AFB8